MDFQQEILSSKNPGETLHEKGGSLYEIIQKLHSEFLDNILPSSVIMPLIRVAEIDGTHNSKINKGILDKVVEALLSHMEKNPDQVPKILSSIYLYIHQNKFYKIFEKIVCLIPELPDYFLLELCVQPISTITQIFVSPESRTNLFLKCRPLFHKFILNTIDPFVNDPLSLDKLLNSIKITIPKNSSFDSFSDVFKFYINLQELRQQTLSQYHSSLCSETANLLLSSCGNAVLSQQLFVVLRDMWEKTGNPLYAALRLELGNLNSRNDPIRQFSRDIFDFLKRQTSENSSLQPIFDLKDKLFVLQDPIFVFLLYCVFLRSLFSRVDKGVYCPFDERKDCKLLLQFIAPTCDFSILENFANSLEAFYVLMAINDKDNKDKNEILASLTEIANESPDLCRLLLFCGQHVLHKIQDSRLIDIPLDIEIAHGDELFIQPDIVVAQFLIQNVSNYGCSGVLLDENGDSANVCDKRLRLIYKWSKINHNIRLYFIALLLKRASYISKIDSRSELNNPEIEVVAKWVDLIRKFVDLDEIEQSMLASIDKQMRLDDD